jgi:tRNA threonylcarbamoyl adenosine modification protein YeaZ
MILAIDTSVGTAVAVVEDDGVVLAEAASANPLCHAEAIGGLLQDALTAASASPGAALAAPGAGGGAVLAAPGAGRGAVLAAPGGERLTHVAAGMGPGPFTGLRVGIAAARAFALGRGIPVVPVVSHDAVALEVHLAGALTDTEIARFAVVTDARRREFAFTVYDGIDDDGLPVRVTEPALIPRDEIDARLAELGAERRDAAVISAAMVAIVAGRAIAAGRTTASSEPLYLRSPDVTMPHGPKRVTA